MGRKAGTDPAAFAWPALAWRVGAAIFLAALAYSSLQLVEARSRHNAISHEENFERVRRPVEWPLQIPDTQYEPVNWNAVDGWRDDDPSAALKAFRASCVPIAAQTTPLAESRALGTSLRDPCLDAKSLDAKSDVTDAAKARAFFESHFVPLKISRLGDPAGFVTGYYEPIVDGSRTQSEAFPVPVYRRPSNLFVRGFTQASASLPNKGQVFRKIGRRKLVPYYDRGAIEDGAIAGRGLEVVWLRNQTDLLFIQIQGSARIRLEDGSIVRINYDSHNGYPYTPVGRVLIERNIVPKAEMSMQRIREYMEQNPDAATELRRQNKSYVFFHEVPLSDKDEAVGAQGVALTAGRSIAVDKSLHIYGTPFFVSANLPIDSDKSDTPFHRLMVAQDTGSAIVGPARADIYFGAGKDAGTIAGRVKNAANFTLLLPNSLDPVARGKTVPLPEDRPSEKIAKLFPQTDDSSKAPPKDSATPIPLPEARPQDAPAPQAKPAADAKAGLGRARDADASGDLPPRKFRPHQPKKQQ